MPRPCQRARLDSGLALKLPRLIRDGMVTPGCATSPRSITWRWVGTDEVFASGSICSDLTNGMSGWLRVEMGERSQYLSLRAEPRHFGGVQWYFLCPFTGRKASVLWRPPGAREFAARQAWGRSVAYGSQFKSRFDR